MKNVVALTMVFTLGLLQMSTNKAAATRLQRKQQQQRQQADDILQCYVCENCPDNIDAQPEMALCGGMSSSVVSNGNGNLPIVTTAQAAMTIPALVNGTTKAPELSEEYGDSDYDEEDGDYNEGDEKRAIRTITSTTMQSISATTTTGIPITSTTATVVTTSNALPAIIQNALENVLPEEDFNSYGDDSESESEESIKTTVAKTTTSSATWTTTTTTTTPPNVSVNNNPGADYDNYEYEDMDSEDDDLNLNNDIARQLNPDPNVCYSIKLSNNVTEITNRGCVTLIRGNKALTCQSLSKGMAILDCLVCDTNGCNSYSNQFVPSTVKPSASQGLRVNFWVKIFSVAVLIVAIIIKPQI